MRPRRHHRTLNVVMPRWLALLLPLAVVLSWWGMFELGRRTSRANTPDASTVIPIRASPPLPRDRVGTSSASTAALTSTRALEAEASADGTDERASSATVAEGGRARTASVAPDRPPADGYGVQIGAFEREDELLAFLDRWSLERAYVSEVVLEDGSRWYRVRVGHYPRRRGAVRLAKRWEARLEERPLVVEYP